MNHLRVISYRRNNYLPLNLGGLKENPPFLHCCNEINRSKRPPHQTTYQQTTGKEIKCPPNKKRPLDTLYFKHDGFFMIELSVL